MIVVEEKDLIDLTICSSRSEYTEYKKNAGCLWQKGRRNSASTVDDAFFREPVAEDGTRKKTGK
ncbi:MAG: hypothetical protein ACFFD4_22005 [Candidatus Odinarchaeota archaeon]